ncbi:hypothetical protein, conserved [Eimeria brunetti]|uniref:CCAAT-binding factor domain-containing protein n=1 Tax=Eimeria brunetti TaxID=51314 RepID=U6LQP3_9EIME|nr:hypothetical protein, conserved [Eimeria brunetti]
MTLEGPVGLSSPPEFAAKVQGLVDACRACRRPKDLLQNCEELFRLLCSKKIELEIPFNPSAAFQRKQREEGEDRAEGEDEEALGFEEWLHQSFQVFVSIVFELLQSKEAHLQQLGLSYLFRIVKHEAQVHNSSLFPLSVFQVFIAKLLQLESFSNYLQDILLKDYVRKFVDIRYYLLVVVLKILREFTAKKDRDRKQQPPNTTEAAAAATAAAATAASATAAGAAADDSAECDDAEGDATETNWYTWKRGEAELSKRLTSLLLQLSDTIAKDKHMRKQHKRSSSSSSSSSSSGGGGLNAMDEDEDEDEMVEDAEEETEKGYNKLFISNVTSSKATEASCHRVAFQNAWLLLLLQVQHSSSTLQQLLQCIPRRVMPLLSNPILLSDFFLKSFKDSKRISHRISALSGLFYLLTKHRLGHPELLAAAAAEKEAPKQTPAAAAPAAAAAAAAGAAAAGESQPQYHFYQQLYRLLTPAALTPRLRLRFLRLLHISLRSDLLPTCLIARFIKKCCRVACVAAAAAAVCLQALAAALLQKYFAACKPLLSLPLHVAQQLRIAGDPFDYATAKIKKTKHSAAAAAAAAAGAGAGAGGAAGGGGGSGSAAAAADSSSEDEEEEAAAAAAAEQEEQRQHPLLQLAAASTPAALKVKKKEISPLVRKEAKMALWEIELLNKHALLSVQQLACIFESNFANFGCKKIIFEDFLDISTGSLLAREIKAINKPSAKNSLPLYFNSDDNSVRLNDVCSLHTAAMNIARINK